jgi:hypothetical protein
MRDSIWYVVRSRETEYSLGRDVDVVTEMLSVYYAECERRVAIVGIVVYFVSS